MTDIIMNAMTITDKTRKLLWGKSGNRCAMCKHELSIDATEKDDESVIGEECHILSDKEYGPRYSKGSNINELDSYSNLILLCRIHHKQIDDQSTTYASDVLKRIKDDHEKWVSEKLKDGNTRFKARIKRIKDNIPISLTRITVGKELLDIVSSAHSFQYGNDELKSTGEVERIGQFFDLINDWQMVANETSPGYRVEIEFNLTEQIKELDEAGFWVFGATERQILESSDGKENWTMAIIQIIRKTNKEIVKNVVG